MAHCKKEKSKYTQLIHMTLQESIGVTCAVDPSVIMSSTDFSFQTWFFKIYLNF
jgi:hypothetical protein